MRNLPTISEILSTCESQKLRSSAYETAWLSPYDPDAATWLETNELYNPHLWYDKVINLLATIHHASGAFKSEKLTELMLAIAIGSPSAQEFMPVGFELTSSYLGKPLGLQSLFEFDTKTKIGKVNGTASWWQRLSLRDAYAVMPGSPLRYMAEVMDVQWQLPLNYIADHEEGSFMASPSASTVALSSNHVLPRVKDKVRQYLKTAKNADGGYKPFYRFETFHAAWVLKYLSLLNLTEEEKSEVKERVDGLFYDYDNGSKMSPMYLWDGDTTSVVAYLKAKYLGDTRVINALLKYRKGYYAQVHDFESDKSLTCSAHMLMALKELKVLDVQALETFVSYHEFRDKWHQSPYYASHIVAMSSTYSRKNVYDWTIRRQNADGGFGEWGSTPEETAYALISILLYEQHNYDLLLPAYAYLLANFEVENHSMWIQKNMYYPIDIVNAAKFAAIKLFQQTYNG